MCGICGILDFKEQPLQDTIETMTQAMRHRGPDAQTHWLSGPAALGHVRLSIIELSELGAQPMRDDQGRAVLAYNGEIYNFPELRDELIAEGVAFRGNSDTEIVLQAWLTWGESAFARFKGMFAFALWDEQNQKLMLVRDRFGIKPLYYAQTPGGIVFGSEQKTLLASKRLQPELDWQAVHEYLYYGAALGGGSLFQGVRKLLPGHMLVVDANGMEVKPYASIYDIEPIQVSEDEAVARIRELLDSAVKRHLIADVPVGVFLSGGVDSSAITAFAARHYGAKLRTYSVGFDFDKGRNELPKARQVAEHVGTDHHELHIEGKNMPDVIQKLVRAHDEPFADPANLPLYLLCEALNGEIKVVLQGDGGDEIFGGYYRYARLARQWLFRTLGFGPMLVQGVLPRDSKIYRGLRTIRALKHPDPSMTMALLLCGQDPAVFAPEQVFSGAAKAQFAETDPFKRYRHFYQRFKDLDPVQRMLYTDCGVILPDIFFEKVDKSTMAHGVEVRVPLVDTDLAAYVMALPAPLKIKSGQKKHLLRKAMRGDIPNSILDAKKLGFGVPFRSWLRGPLASFMQDTLNDSSVRDMFDPAQLQICIDQHIAGAHDHGVLLKNLLFLALWRQTYFN